MSGENIFKGCLVESDPEKIARARQAKRRALIVAVILQVLLVGLLVLAPLLGAMEKLPTTSVLRTPIPPYNPGPKEAGPKSEKTHGPRRPPITTGKPVLVAPTRIPPKVADITDPPEAFEAQKEWTNTSRFIGDPDGKVDLDAPSERRAAVPKAPETSVAKPKRPPVEVPPAVQEARLVRRVEPKYPPLPRIAGIEGKVVLRAIIAKDGTIQSLEIISGSPLFAEATREAILQWRYQPTLLHGEPVEVETMITVVFTLRR
jgi:protein TonB